MSKNLILFIVVAILLVVGKVVYCKSSADRCKDDIVDESLADPVEGQDW